MRNGPYELVPAPGGYPGKLYRGKYVYEHHLVWWQHTGTTVHEGSLLHHKNENKRDNRFENLELKSRSAHSAEHSTARTRGVQEVACGWCGKVFELPVRIVQERKRNGQAAICCSSSHGALLAWSRRKCQ